MEHENIKWDQIAKKEAIGIDDYDLGEVQEVRSEYVLTQKGLVDKKLFQIPKELAVRFDGSKIIFRLSEADANSFSLMEKSDLDNETTIPVIEERSEPAKKENVVEAKIVKEPIKETKQVDVQLTHEELVIERKRLAEPRKTDEEPVQSRTEIKIRLKREEVEVNKQS